MKTTIDISDALFKEAKTTAARGKTTVRSLVEEGLRRVLQGTRSRKGFKLRSAAFKGRGVQSGLREGDWAALRERIYAGQGG